MTSSIISNETGINPNTSEPYTIIDAVTRKTIKQMTHLEKAIAELWERRAQGEQVELIGDLHSNEKRAWGE